MTGMVDFLEIPPGVDPSKYLKEQRKARLARMDGRDNTAPMGPEIKPARKRLPLDPVTAERLCDLHCPKDPMHTFGRFFEGRSNTSAVTAARMFQEGKGESSAVVLKGPSGCGKTHLLEAIVAANDEHPWPRRLVYITQDKLRSLANSHGGTLSAASRADGVLIDDIDSLGTERQHSVLSNLLLDLLACRVPVIVASSRLPRELERLGDQVCTRLSSGLICEIEGLEFEARRMVIDRAIADTESQLTVPEAIRDSLAGAAKDGRTCTSLVRNLMFPCWIEERSPTEVDAQRAIVSVVGEPGEVAPKVEDIRKVVADIYRLTISDIVSERRDRPVVRPRQLAMYLSRTYTTHSLPYIARKFGKRDHATVIHAVRKIEQLMANDRSFAAEVAHVRSRLGVA